MNAYDTSNWSDTSCFTTLYNTPSKPTQTSPVNGKTGTASYVTLEWIYQQGSLSSDIQVATDPNFSTKIINDTTIDHYYVLSPLLPSTTYYWRVRTKNLMGTGAWSDTWSFTTSLFPTLISPANNASGVTSPVTLTWNALPASANIKQYYVILYYSALWRTVDHTYTYTLDYTTTTTSVTCTFPSVRSDYTLTGFSWKVQGVYSDGSTTEWSPTWSFVP